MLLSSLTCRDKQPEIMDQPGLEVSQHVQALTGLTRINWISGSVGNLWKPIQDLALENQGRTLRVLDVATGAGDVPIGLQRRAEQAGLNITFAGVDISPTAVQFAKERARNAGATVDFGLLDALNAELPADFDVITCSLFLHHLEPHEAEVLLRKMAHAARSMILVDDLIRSRLGFLLAYFGTRLLSTCPVVHSDGPQSVRAAFTVAEAKELAQRAGLDQASFLWHWPYRFLLQWRRPHA